MPTKLSWPLLTTPIFRTLLLLALCGCPVTPATPEPPPQPSASPLAPRFVLRVQTLSGVPVATARLQISHPLQPTRQLSVNSAGEADLSQLESGLHYLLEISADQHLPLQRWLVVPKQAQQRQTVVMLPAQATLQGQVLSDQGTPLAQAVVQRGDLRVLTDSAGRFQLPQSLESSGPLEIAKQGYLPWSGPPGGARYALGRVEAALRLRTHPVLWPHQQLRAATQTAGYQILPGRKHPWSPAAISSGWPALRGWTPPAWRKCGSLSRPGANWC